MKVSEAIEQYTFAITHLSPKTQRGYLDCLNRFSKWCDKQGLTLDKVKAIHTRKYLEELRQTPNEKTGQPLSSYYVHYHARSLRAFLRWCSVEEGLDEYVTTRAAKVTMPRLEKKVISIFTPEEINKLLAACKKEAYPELQSRTRTIILVLLDTGIRASELCDLTLDDVHLTAGNSYIKVRGKGMKEREVGLGNKASKALYTHINRFRHAPTEERHVFLTRTHTPMTYITLDKVLYRLADWAGVEDCHAHKFRHTFAVRYLEAGGELFDLSRLMGHTTTFVTRLYLEYYTSRQVRMKGISVMDNLK